MIVADLISDLATRGVRLVASPDGTRLGYQPAGSLTPELRAAIIDHKTALLAMLRADRWPIIPGTEHWNPWITEADADAGRWGEEFIPGYHVDIRQPSRLRGLCAPINHERKIEHGPNL